MSDTPEKPAEVKEDGDEVAATEYSSLKAEVTALEKNLKAEISARNTVEDALEQTLDTLKQDNARLKDHLDDKWKLPKFAFGLVTTLAAIFFGVNLGFQFLSIVQVRNKAEKLESRIEAAITDVRTTQASMDQVESKLIQMRDTVSVEAESARKSVVATVEPVGAAHRVISYSGLARHQLVHEGDVARSEHYSRLAIEELTATITSVQGTPNSNDLTKMLNELWPIIWAVEAESLLHRHDYLTLRDKSSEMLRHDPDCFEGNFYSGLTKLYFSLDRIDELKEDDEELRLASDYLAKAVKVEKQDGFSHIFLAATLLLSGNIDAANRRCGRFLMGKPRLREPAIQRLSARERAKIALATTVQRLAAAVASSEPSVESRVECCIDVGAIGPVIGEVFEKVFTSIASNRKSFSTNQRSANLVGLYCADIVLSLRRACQSSCVTSNVADLDPGVFGKHVVTRAFGDLAREWKLAPMPNYVFALNPEDVDFDYREDGLEFEYTVSVPVTEHRTKEYTVNGETRTRTVAVTVYRQELRTAMIWPDSNILFAKFLTINDLDKLRTGPQQPWQPAIPEPEPEPYVPEAPAVPEAPPEEPMPPPPAPAELPPPAPAASTDGEAAIGSAA